MQENVSGAVRKESNSSLKEFGRGESSFLLSENR